MRLGIIADCIRSGGLNRSKLIVAGGLLFLLAQCAPLARAQQRNDATAAPTDLALENQSRVAASVNEIKEVLEKDAGMMVELKHWVAKDASDHGQILSDSDLTSDAIFTRLENDVQFRSIATALVERCTAICMLPK